MKGKKEKREKIRTKGKAEGCKKNPRNKKCYDIKNFQKERKKEWKKKRRKKE